MRQERSIEKSQSWVREGSYQASVEVGNRLKSHKRRMRDSWIARGMASARRDNSLRHKSISEEYQSMLTQTWETKSYLVASKRLKDWLHRLRNSIILRHLTQQIAMLMVWWMLACVKSKPRQTSRRASLIRSHILSSICATYHFQKEWSYRARSRVCSETQTTTIASRRKVTPWQELHWYLAILCLKIHSSVVKAKRIFLLQLLHRTPSMAVGNWAASSL